MAKYKIKDADVIDESVKFTILIVAPCVSSNYLISIPTDAHT